MAQRRAGSIARSAVGVLALAAGLAAFLVPLHHPGPYGIPGRGLWGGLAALALGAVLLAPSVPRALRAAALVASPFVLFFALYGALAELEEVVVLDPDGAALRLWIVDADGTEWVSMQRAKAEAHGLDGARLELRRGGETRCVVPRIVEDPPAGQRTFDLRDEKYAVQRFARSIGMFGEGPDPGIVTLRLDPCP